MPDERMDSIREGVAPPPESPEAKRAAEERRRKLAEEPPVEEGLGGTSDAETAADEARMDAARWRGPERGAP
ncbi:MAG TPA: hypothetical protein VFS05_16710 [Gemmatimonadaceae bacterium]|nr:hypothetical protein [Gemmatimonadaceae bacterium]